MKISRKAVSVGAVTVALALSMICIEISPVFASSESSLDSKVLLPVLSLPQTAVDRPAAQALAGPVGEAINPSSLKLLASSGVARYYASEGKDDAQVCLLVVFAEPGISAAGCAERQLFYKNGISVKLSGDQNHPEQVTTAYLLPADAHLDPKTSPANKIKAVFVNQIIIVPRGGQQPAPDAFIHEKTGKILTLEVLDQE